MTTIATDGKSMASDGFGVMNGVVVDTDNVKVVRLSDGSLFGSCGSSTDADRLAAWMNAGSEGDWPKRSDNFGAIILRPNGDLFTVSDSDGFVKARAPLAIGSGMEFALGAMDAGSSPAEAVRIAIGRNPYSGGTITEIKLNDD